MSDELWVPLSDFPDYEVSSLGRVRSWKGPGGRASARSREPKILRSPANSKGYPVNVFLSASGKRHTKTLHVLIATAFHGPCPRGFECSHLNGIRADCRAKNLRWESHKRNMERTVEHGTSGAGSRNGRAKLSQAQADEIRPRRDAGESLSSIARDFGVSVSAIWQIYHGKNWRR